MLGRITHDEDKIVGEDIILPIKTNLSSYGEIVDDAIKNISNIYSNVYVDKYCIMPNHIHLIIICSVENNGRILSAPTISTIIGQLKRCVTKQIGFSLWQKSFFDHIIRNENEYKKIWSYIHQNPLKWEVDKYYINRKD